VKVWLSGEVQADVAEACRVARNAVTEIAEAGLRDGEYGKGLLELSLICIVLEDVDDFPEIKRYEKKNRIFDIRLQIPHTPFKLGDAHAQQHMVMYTLIRAVREMRSLGVKDVDYDRLELDLTAIAKRHKLA
jgi:hypothetical protein